MLYAIIAPNVILPVVFMVKLFLMIQFIDVEEYVPVPFITNVVVPVCMLFCTWIKLPLIYSVFPVQTGIPVDDKVRVITYKSDSSVIVGDALVICKLFNGVGIVPKLSVADALIINVVLAQFTSPEICVIVPVLKVSVPVTVQLPLNLKLVEVILK